MDGKGRILFVVFYSRLLRRKFVISTCGETLKDKTVDAFYFSVNVG